MQSLKVAFLGSILCLVSVIPAFGGTEEFCTQAAAIANIILTDRQDGVPKQTLKNSFSTIINRIGGMDSMHRGFLFGEIDGIYSLHNYELLNPNDYEQSFKEACIIKLSD